MITYKDKQLFIDGKSTLLMAGEIHYFRLPTSEWQDRIDRLKEAGMNTVATYIPWVAHEPEEGMIDLEGKTNPQLNLKAFIELCQSNGLYIFLRPGPFIMAETKNDGIPFWMYKNYPETIPSGFDGEEATTPTLDYLAPNFLKASKNWYREVMGLISNYTMPNGGKVIAVQLDNEIGMLSWVSNRPDLTPFVLDSFAEWLSKTYSEDELSKRYPFSFKDKSFHQKLVSPQPPYDVYFHRDLGWYMRARFEKYIYTLKEYSEEFGVKDILFVVNIHGTGGGRGFTYPIGVSQLMETYKYDDNVIAGSDVYFDHMHMGNFQDMYLCNGITECINDFGKPLTSVEFNCGDCNFGDDFGNRNPAFGNDFRTRLFIAQGNKLINYYLFCGGQNYRLDKNLGDGNDRIATTGENHGFAAPIGPTGIPNQTYPRMIRVTNQIMALNEKLASSFIEYDNVAYGFIPDDFMTEYVYRKSEKAVEMYKNLEKNRTGNVWESTMRALLLLGAAPKTVNLQSVELDEKLVYVVPSSEYMSQKLQRKLLTFIENGGSLLLHGQVPRFDDEANPCTILADALETSNFEKAVHKHKYDASIVPQGFLKGSNEYHCSNYETMDVKNAEVILSKYDDGRTCGFYKQIGKGKIVVLSVFYKSYLHQYKKIMDVLGIKPALKNDIDIPGVGVFMTITKNSADEQFLYLINMDDVDKDFNVYYNDSVVIPERKIHLPENEALMLPLNVKFDCGMINYSTIEIKRFEEKSIVFRNTEKYSVISIKTEATIKEASHYTYEKTSEGYIIHTDNRLLEDEIIVSFE